MKKVLVRKGSYYDSVFLMLVNQEAKKLKGVSDAVVAMGTDMNRDLLAGMGFRSPEIASATPNDLIIGLEGSSASALDEALEAAQKLLQKRSGGGQAAEEHRPATLDAALRVLPEANVAVISLPGAYAAREAGRALRRGLHVMLFSDNVSLDDEVRLKALARERGLLMMGPDCGTAIINGMPLCFANVVRRGAIGVVAASGTGLQEVTCCIDRLGSGVSQAIGTGGRDLKNDKVGGSTMLMGIEALAADPRTRVIVVISKPPAPSVAERVIAALADAGKPAVVHLIGLPPRETVGSVRFAGNLEETAAVAVAAEKGREHRPRAFSMAEREVDAIVTRETRGVSPGQKHLRGLFTGGTLADEAMILLSGLPGGVFSNNQTDPALVLADAHISRANTIVDLGDDVFTVGRPHPMIDPSIRVERLAREARDPSVAVVLLDLVLGTGSHADPAGALVQGVADARAAFARRGGRLSVIASVTGTPGDFQGMEAQKGKLEAAGVVVMPSNFQASMLALRIMERLASRGAAKRGGAKRAPAGRAPAERRTAKGKAPKRGAAKGRAAKRAPSKPAPAKRKAKKAGRAGGHKR